MKKGLEELVRLKDLLLIEKEEDLEQFKKQVQELPLAERKAKGVSWYPVEVVKSGYTYGDRAFVEVQREVHGEEAHQFRAGKSINLFTQQAGVSNPERKGVVHFVNKNRMRVILGTKDLPDWLGMGQIGLDLLFDERSYLEMEKALDTVMKASKGRLAELRNVLLGKQEPYLMPIAHPISIPALNESQNAAVNKVLRTRDVAIIHGPPGTGKTTTLVQTIKLLCKTEATVLVTAPSNTAVDLLTERLAREGLTVVRIGNISRVDESIMLHTLDMQLSSHPDSKNIKKVKVQAADLRRKARRFKRNFGREEYQERKDLYREAGELSAWANQLEDRLIQQILDGAQVICSTLVGASHPVLEKRHFPTVVIDEAAQALEPATWIPIIRASRVIMAGDPFQLPPTVKSNEAQRKGFNISLIEKGVERLPDANLLRTQYRMNASIMGFSNAYFYDNRLHAAEEVADWTLDIEANLPLQFIDTAGCGFDELLHEAYQSRYNPDEFKILCEHLYLLLEAYSEKEQPSIGIISPYSEQVKYMKQVISEDVTLSASNLSVNTIDGFQGQERDVVYISLVRSNAKGEIGFLKDYRRMNVAMTRARKLLVIVGDSATIGQDKFYNQFLEYCEQEGSYGTAWEYMQ